MMKKLLPALVLALPAGVIFPAHVAGDRVVERRLFPDFFLFSRHAQFLT